MSSLNDVSPTGDNHRFDSAYAGDGTTCIYNNVATLSCHYRDELILQGSGMSNGNLHDHKNLPLVLVGGGGGQLRVRRNTESGGRVVLVQHDAASSSDQVEPVASSFMIAVTRETNFLRRLWSMVAFTRNMKGSRAV